MFLSIVIPSRLAKTFNSLLVRTYWEPHEFLACMPVGQHDDDKSHLLPRGRMTTRQSGEPRATGELHGDHPTWFLHYTGVISGSLVLWGCCLFGFVGILCLQ